MNSKKILALLSEHLPAGAINYCFGLWRAQPFDFKLRKSRLTKVGDFTCYPGRHPRITVNQDLHPFLFLVTYIHEVAHLDVHRQFGNSVEGHGKEWKQAFRLLLEPVLNESIFPADLLTALTGHMTDPRASSYSDPELVRVFRQYDPQAETLIFLSDIPEGSIFGIRGRWFRKGETKRTRVLCQEMKSKRKYFVPMDAPVENVQLSLL
jgi:SprT protein